MSLDRVLTHFRNISQIPRGSGNEQAISDYLVTFAQGLGLEVQQDKLNNVIIKKAGKAGAEPVILQGHMDMVCEKVEGSDHDFLKDAIELVQEGHILRANGTTLGADNGIAVAMAMALLESDDPELPPLEVLITTSEETDMSGALGLEAGQLEGKKLINIDSEEEGIITVGSAGGSTLTYKRKIEREPNEFPCYVLDFSGLLGGHSGMEIDKPRGNMLKIMAELIADLMRETSVRIVELNSGTVDNAIPRNGKLILAVADRGLLEAAIERSKERVQGIEGELKIEVSEGAACPEAYSEALSRDLVHLISELPTGVNTMVEGTQLVESSNNLAYVREVDGEIVMQNSLRSSNHEKLEEHLARCEKAATAHEFLLSRGAGYPGWEYNPDSELRRHAEAVYRELTGQEAETLIIHAGLECGAISEKYPGLDMISIGPNIWDVHTPQEHIDLESTARVFDYLVALLHRLAKS